MGKMSDGTSADLDAAVALTRSAYEDAIRRAG